MEQPGLALICDYGRAARMPGNLRGRNDMKVLARRGRSRAVAAIAVLATIALFAASASPAQAVQITQGRTTLTFDQNIFSVLDPLGIGMLPIAPAEATLGGEAFPISGGRVTPNGRRARIAHVGGLDIAGDNASVRLVRLRVRLCCRSSGLTASVGGQRISFLALGRGTRIFRGRRLTIRGINAFLTLEAANALNQAFAPMTNPFQEGTQLGTLRIRMRLAS